MGIKKIPVYFILILVLLFAYPLYAEKISLKLSFNTNSYADGDLKTWVQSLNTQWRDYSTEFPGSVTGEFAVPSYGSNIEIELRIPIFKGFGLNLAGSRLSGSEEGEVTYRREESNQEEAQYLLNDVSGLNLKIGFSYAAELPFLEGLHLFGNVGRQLIYAKYDTINNRFQFTETFGSEFTYEGNQENSFKSDSLGWYAGLGVEYDVIQHVAIVFEIEKIWSEVAGFKGTHLYNFITTRNGIVDDELSFSEEGKASIYYFEDQIPSLEKYYEFLEGYIDQPDKESIQNLRSGKLNFSTLSLKFGIRFKF
jgi:opacity protein-like surface antigen